MSLTHITVRGARQHNLKNISVSIPRNTLTVVTGLSGSGKSSLAFDTIYAEGQRRYVETLSAYARQFLDQMERPDVDAIDGLSPAISIEQKTTSRSPRSTVGTITEIYDYLRLLWASVGQPHCPNCHRPITRQSAEQIVARIVETAVARIAAGAQPERITVMAPIVRGRKGEFREELEALDQQGFRVRIDGEMTEITEGMRLEKRKNHTIEAVVDRIILKPSGEQTPPDANAALATEPDEATPPRYETKRLEGSVTKALGMASGLVLIGIQDPETRVVGETLYSSSMACPDCGINVPKLEPRSFSFNSTYGACPDCHGLGSIYDFDAAKTITDWSKPLLDGAMGPGSASSYLLRLIKLAGEKYKIDLKRPFAELPKPHQDLLLYGPPKSEASRTGFHGIFAYLRSNLEETRSEGYREYMMQYMSATACPVCKGPAASPGVACRDAAGRRHRTRQWPWSVAERSARTRDGSVDRRLHRAASGPGADRSSVDAVYRAGTVDRRSVAARDHRAAGVPQCRRPELPGSGPIGSYALGRARGSASGWPRRSDRACAGVLYVLDEPSIGLHQRDNQRLIAALERLHDLGNTVLVVEHDEDTMRKADYLLDLGPGAGKHGGHLIAEGTPAEVMANPASVTGQYLAGRLDTLNRPANAAGETGPRELTGNWVTVEDARSHNLQDVTAHFPLGVMTVVTGVSGSGKSSLVNDILYRALAKELYGSREEPGQHGKVIGIDQLDKGHSDRPVADRAHAALQPGHLYGRVYGDPRPLRDASGVA